MEVTRFTAQFAKVIANGDSKAEVMIRKRIVARESSYVWLVPQLARVILMNGIMYSLRARRDFLGMSIQTARITKASKQLGGRVDVQVELLTELLRCENATDPETAQINHNFLDWAVHARTPRTIDLQESA